MKHSFFITGYPGFLASSLIRQLVKDHGSTLEHTYLLVLPEQEAVATAELAYFIKQEKLNLDDFTIIPGDITLPNFGMDEKFLSLLEETVTHVFHLAAIYDLAVPKDAAYNVNVHGTKTVNNWVQGLPQLKRYIYFSTAYVSGTREGHIYEKELRANQGFKNHYEETKYEAELLVEAMKEYVPTTIIRPGIVKGNSKTGETIKFDGMYFMLNLFDRLALSPILPYLGDSKVEGNFVPSDYVLEATSYLAFAGVGAGKTYHLTDPHPYQMRDLYKMLAEAYLGKTPKGTIPLPIAGVPMQSKAIQKWLKVERESLAYSTFNASYDASQATLDLEGSGIKCPDMKDTIEPMISFYRKYKDDQKKHIL